MTATPTTAPAPGASAIANNFYTFEPDIALSWLQGGWNFYRARRVRLQHERRSHQHPVGQRVLPRLHRVEVVGKWTFGAGGNYTKQFTCDTGSGNTSGCNEAQHVLAGPLMGYNFGPAEINAKALFGVSAENAANASFYHLGVSFPF